MADTIKKPDANPVVALLLTWFVLGTGHLIVNGQKKKWIMSLVGCLLGIVACCVGAPIMGIMSIIEAYKTAQKLQAGREIGEHEFAFEPYYKIMKKFYKEATFVA